MTIQELIDLLYVARNELGEDCPVNITPDPDQFGNKYNHNANEIGQLLVPPAQCDEGEKIPPVLYLTEGGESRLGRYNHLPHSSCAENNPIQVVEPTGVWDKETY
jgi:hypothetical protein